MNKLNLTNWELNLVLDSLNEKWLNNLKRIPKSIGDVEKSLLVKEQPVLLKLIKKLKQ